MTKTLEHEIAPQFCDAKEAAERLGTRDIDVEAAGNTGLLLTAKLGSTAWSKATTGYHRGYLDDFSQFRDNPSDPFQYALYRFGAIADPPSYCLGFNTLVARIAMNAHNDPNKIRLNDAVKLLGRKRDYLAQYPSLQTPRKRGDSRHALIDTTRFLSAITWRHCLFPEFNRSGDVYLPRNGMAGLIDSRR